MNELLMLCVLVIGILSLYFANKLLNTFGIKIVFITFNLLSLILSFKYLTLSSFHVNASVLTQCIIFTCICMLIEKDLLKENNKVINTSLIINILASLLLYIMSNYTQSINDTVGINITNVFYYNSRILIIYPIANYLSLKITTYLYLKVKKIYDSIFISMVSTYLASGLINFIIVTFGSYYKILKIQDIIKLLLSSYMIELIIIVIYSIIITLLKSKKVKKWLIYIY